MLAQKISKALIVCGLKQIELTGFVTPQSLLLSF